MAGAANEPFPGLTREQVDALLLAQNARVEVADRILVPTIAECTARERLANNGRNPANKNEGIRTGSDLHFCEILIKQLDGVRKALELRPFAARLVNCEACQSEGRILTNDGGPDDKDHGVCPVCNGAGVASPPDTAVQS